MGDAQDADNILLQSQIKKELYKQKPTAILETKNTFCFGYYCHLKIFGRDAYTVRFTVPIKDMAETEFTNTIPAQLLIRYLDIL